MRDIKDSGYCGILRNQIPFKSNKNMECEKIKAAFKLHQSMIRIKWLMLNFNGHDETDMMSIFS